MRYLLLKLILDFIYLGVSPYISDDKGLLVWALYLLIQPVVLSLAIKNLFSNPVVKVVNFIVLITSSILFVNFVLEWFLFERFENISRILNIILMLIVLPLCFNAIFKLFVVENSTYEEGKSYFGFKKPVNIFGLIAALVKSPYGHCFLITKGKMFKFSKGIVKEVDYKHSDDFCLRRIKNVPLSEAEKLVGRKWTLFNNCFTIFKVFK
jgi:hypothetical protein